MHVTASRAVSCGEFPTRNKISSVPSNPCEGAL
jgi:hypothetical protein